MKDSKWKILLPIILIPIILVICVCLYVYNCVQSYNNGYKDSISQKDIAKYLQSKQEGEFDDIKLINTTRKASVRGGSGCPTDSSPYDDEFIFYYTAYSKKYNTEFLIKAKKQIFSVTWYGCEKPEEEIKDNLDNAKNDKRYFEIIDKMLSQYNYTMTRDYKEDFFYRFDVDVKFKIDDNFNEEHYSKLLKINELINNEHQKMIEENLEVSIGTIYFEFNDKTFSHSLWSLYMENEQGMDTVIASWNKRTDINEENDKSIDIQTKKIDEISGHTYIEKDDNSLLVLHNDGTFIYYKDKNELTDYYYEGKYNVYNGDEAIQYIAEDLEKYGVTKEEQMNIFERNPKYKKDAYYCIILKNEKCIINGKNTLTDIEETPYFGFFFEDESTLNIVNMKSANKYNFIKQY